LPLSPAMSEKDARRVPPAGICEGGAGQPASLDK
jgi:hypothetical protein